MAANPFERGTARWRRWNRENKNPRRVEKRLPSDTSRRRKSLDAAIDDVQAENVNKLRDAQSTDSSQ